MACRISLGEVVAGSGAPNEIVTGRGIRSGQPALLHRAEDAGGRPVDVDGDDRHVPPLDDPLHAPLERQWSSRSG